MKAQKNTKIMVTCALLVALQVILARFLSINTTFVVINFSFLAVALSGILFGPLWALAVGAVSDLIGATLFPFGAFFPGFTAAGHRDFCAEHFPAFRAGRFQMLMDFFRLPEKRALRGFSTGQKNQFEVILALCQGADYILMDEPFAGNDVFNREDFYKVLLGILEPTETILLSTHLLEEVQHFISRAVLLRSGRIAGDVTTAALEERSQSLMDYVRSACGYEPGRVLQALERMDGRGEE